MAFPWPPIDEEIRAAVARQLDEDISIYGRTGIIARFEDAFAARHRAEFALLTSSGTAALHSAYYALGIGPGDEVIVQDYTFFATAMPLLICGALPVLADVEADGALNLAAAAALVTERTKAVVVTHMWGAPQDMRALRTWCDRHRLALIEDCSHAHGASRDGIGVGELADASVFSLQGKKMITAGEGGILLTPHREVYDKATLLGHFNKRAVATVDQASPLHAYAETGLGLKYRAHPLGLAMAEVYLSRLDGWLEHKARHAAQIQAVLEDRPGIRLITPAAPDRTPTFYALVFTIDDQAAGFSRDELLAAVREQGCDDLETCTAMNPLHTYPVFRDTPSPVHTYQRSGIRSPLRGAQRIAETSLRVTVPADDSRASRAHTDHVVTCLRTALDRLTVV
jgi:dTDP-4-amino-4,6-dideoxygalactose transaminase